ncbi:RNB domain-containing ribonuclease [Neomicrococcus lactis]|uniref:Exoribonuclease R n=1 Tax=Neomicrococcus lactis TaxID=732241 RepID=A0A7W8Y918_9MICC|nr:RNB domain-containing ribonuclease [Neomicrococcus lactis]MBB5597195.1 exoribonuclease R [Neomicrococcus lactis]
MVHQHIDLSSSAHSTRLEAALAALVQKFELPTEFPADVLAEAQAAVTQHDLPEEDRTDIDFVTIDPASSTDLDQAVFIQREGSGYRVFYAIADVPSFVQHGGALDAETRKRGMTIYLPQGRIPLHPEVISEDAGSLLPDQLRSAYIWNFELDDAANVTSVSLGRAQVKSRAKLSYDGVQKDLDAGTASESLQLLREVGEKRIALERARGGASLRIPEQEVEADGEHFKLVQRAPLPVEDWNAQISLMTGMAAAEIMLEHKVGILRTMPAPDEPSIAKFRAQAKALGAPWSQDVKYGEFLRSLDLSDPKQLALMHQASSLFRGAGYTAFDGEAPEEPAQSAIAAPYAHTTAPLRRLIDRFVLELCDCLVNGRPIPDTLRAALPELPDLMQAAGQLASKTERAALDTIEAAILASHVGEVFEGVSIEAPTAQHLEKAQQSGRKPYGTVQLTNPPVTAKYEGNVAAGEHVRVVLKEADIEASKVSFEVAGSNSPETTGDNTGENSGEKVAGNEHSAS